MGTTVVMTEAPAHGIPGMARKPTFRDQVGGSLPDGNPLIPPKGSGHAAARNCKVRTGAPGGLREESRHQRQVTTKEATKPSSQAPWPAFAYRNEVLPATASEPVIGDLPKPNFVLIAE